MANEMYIELETAQIVAGGSVANKFRVDIGPINIVEDSYIKTPMITPIPVSPGEAEDPITTIVDTKETSHKFTITGDLVLNDGDTTNGVTRLKQDTSEPEGLQDPASKIGRIRILYGYGEIENTRLLFYNDGVEYYGYLTRFTANKTGGETTFSYILEFFEGEDYDTAMS